jgi:Right handed beta helix region
MPFLSSQTRSRFGAAVALLLFVAVGLMQGSTALAVDGVIDVNNAAVGQFPFSIDQSGSYRLTGNLTVTSGVDGIDVTADNVNIDLNGFSIIGAGGGAGVGIASSNSQVTVRNGTVTGMGSSGITLGANATVADVHAVANGGNGIVVGNASLVTHSNVSANSLIGISITGSGSTVVENSVYNNSGFGMQLSDSTTGFARNVFLFNNGNHTVGSLVPSQLNPTSSGGNQMGSNVCNGVACP